MVDRLDNVRRDLGQQIASTALQNLTRRHFLGRMGTGVGAMALAALASDENLAHALSGASGIDGLDFQRPHHSPRAKRIIYVHLAGSPPQHDLFDPKPKLADWSGKKCPEHLLDPDNFAFIKGHPEVLPSPYSFAKHGESGMEFSELLPHLGRHADRMTMVRTLHTDQFNHAPAQLLLYTGSPRLGRPSMGSWISYGLGTGNRDLPSYVVLVSGGKTPSAGKSVWGKRIPAIGSSGRSVPWFRRSDSLPLKPARDPARYAQGNH